MISGVQIRDVLRSGIIPGALSGLAGGVVFGIAMLEQAYDDWWVRATAFVCEPSGAGS